jgi:hypothetical protein
MFPDPISKDTWSVLLYGADVAINAMFPLYNHIWLILQPLQSCTSNWNLWNTTSLLPQLTNVSGWIGNWRSEFNRKSDDWAQKLTKHLLTESSAQTWNKVLLPAANDTVRWKWRLRLIWEVAIEECKYWPVSLAKQPSEPSSLSHHLLYLFVWGSRSLQLTSPNSSVTRMYI